MTIFGGIRTRARRLRNRVIPRAAILLYHRVVKLKTDPQLLCASPEHFAGHMEILRDRYHPVSLLELAECIQSKKIPRNAVAITFDDGYADNLTYAKPILEKHGIPATFFITSGQINQREEFWWDELERLILTTERLPQKLELEINATVLTFDLGEAVVFQKECQEKYANWDVFKSEPTERHKLYRQLCQVIKPLSPSSRRVALQHLRKWAGDSGDGRTSHRALTFPELKELAASKLCEIGAHTVNHPTLSALDQPSQRFEIKQSRTELEEILGRPVRSFSYPFGTKGDYNAETVSCARQAGFSSVCSNFQGLVQNGTEPFELPRYLVRDWKVETFTSNLKSWFKD